MPELPEVEALALDLRGRLTDRAITRVDLAAFSALKTFDPPLHAIHGTLVEDVTRHGKFLDISTSGLHLVIHLARAGWIRWRDDVPKLPARPNSKSPLAARVVLDEDDEGFTNGLDITEMGTKKSLAIYVVRDPRDVAGIARLGPDPLDDAFTIEVLAQILQDAGRSQIKGVLRHQGTIAGIGNAYSDELLHAARMSPFKPANSLERRRAPDLVRRRPQRPGRRRRALERAGHERAEGREEVQPRRARPHRRDVSGLRRHRAGGQLRRLQPAVLPDLPDRRQAAGRPPDEPPAEVTRGRPWTHVSSGLRSALEVGRRSAEVGRRQGQREPQSREVVARGSPRPPPDQPGAA